MEGRVEAGDRRDLRQQPRHGFERRERLRLVERRQIRKRVQPSHDGRVDRDRLDELRAAVDDPVADGVDRVAAPNDVQEPLLVEAAGRRRDVLRDDEAVLFVATTSAARSSRGRSGRLPLRPA